MSVATLHSACATHSAMSFALTAGSEKGCSRSSKADCCRASHPFVGRSSSAWQQGLRQGRLAIWASLSTSGVHKMSQYSTAGSLDHGTIVMILSCAEHHDLMQCSPASEASAAAAASRMAKVRLVAKLHCLVPGVCLSCLKGADSLNRGAWSCRTLLLCMLRGATLVAATGPIEHAMRCLSASGLVYWSFMLSAQEHSPLLHAT